MMTEWDSSAPYLERPSIDVLAQGRCSVDLTFLGLPHLPRLGEEYYVSLTVLTVGLSFPQDRAFITWEEQDVFGSRGVVLDDLRCYRVGCLFSHVAFTALGPTELSVHLSQC